MIRHTVRARLRMHLLAMIAFVVLVLGVAAWPPNLAGASPLWSPATTTADLNLRSGPGTGYQVLTVMPEGSQVSALTEEPQNGFFRVRYGSLEGWASATYLAVGSGPGDPGGDPSGPTARVTTALNLRAGPGTGYQILAVMPAGAVVTVHDQAGEGFVRVTYNGMAGWAYRAYLDYGDGPGGNTAVVTTSLNLRAGPSLNDRVILVMPAGSRVQVHQDGDNGFALVTYNGIQGWAYGAYLA